MIKLYLCSQSPRRRELLAKLVNNYSCLSIRGEEPRYSSGQAPKSYLQECMNFKIEGAQDLLRHKKEALFLVADTIVVHKTGVLGKPRDRKEAVSTLKFLSGQKHEVWTSFCLGQCESGRLSKKIQRLVKSQVSFYSLSDAEIKAYVRSGDADDKAGAYGFQEAALKFVKSVDGTYTNIMGLPLIPIEKALRKLCPAGLLKSEIS